MAPQKPWANAQSIAQNDSLVMPPSRHILPILGVGNVRVFALFPCQTIFAISKFRGKWCSQPYLFRPWQNGGKCQVFKVVPDTGVVLTATSDTLTGIFARNAKQATFCKPGSKHQARKACMKILPIFLVLFLAITATDANCAASLYNETELARLQKFVNTIYNATYTCDETMDIDTVNRPYDDDQALDMARRGLLYAGENVSKTVRDG